jgi:hypothetical protein
MDIRDEAIALAEGCLWESATLDCYAPGGPCYDKHADSHSPEVWDYARRLVAEREMADKMADDADARRREHKED